MTWGARTDTGAPASGAGAPLPPFGKPLGKLSPSDLQSVIERGIKLYSMCVSLPLLHVHQHALSLYCVSGQVYVTLFQLVHLYLCQHVRAFTNVLLVLCIQVYITLYLFILYIYRLSSCSFFFLLCSLLVLLSKPLCYVFRQGEPGT